MHRLNNEDIIIKSDGFYINPNDIPIIVYEENFKYYHLRLRNYTKFVWDDMFYPISSPLIMFDSIDDAVNFADYIKRNIYVFNDIKDFCDNLKELK